MAKSLVLALLVAVALGLETAELTRAATPSDDGHTGLVMTISPTVPQSLLPGEVRDITVTISVARRSTFDVHAQIVGATFADDAVVATLRLDGTDVVYQGPLGRLDFVGQAAASVAVVLDIQIGLTPGTGDAAAGQQFHVDWVVTAQLTG